jgi:hypothetical protein
MRSLTKFEWLAVLESKPYIEAREEYTVRMEENGFKIVMPGMTELLIDIDSEEAFNTFKERFVRLKCEERFKQATAKWKVSKSGLPHRHIIVDLKVRISTSKRIALQAILGSDPIREMLSLFRLSNGDPYPSLLAINENGEEWEDLSI